MTLRDRALLEAVLLGAACGPLSVWLLAFRHAFAAESLSHAMLPGLAVAAAAGAPLLLGGAGGVLAAALLVALAARDRRIGGDTAIAVTVTALFGLGALLAIDARTPLADLLFGDLLGVTDADLIAAAVLAVAIPLALAAGHRALTAVAFSPAAAPALGIAPARTEAALLVLLAAAIVVAVQGLGNLLVLALLVAPGVAARAGGALRARLLIAAAVGAGSGALGVVASDRLGTAAGASVALVLVAAALIASGARTGGGGTPAAPAVRRSPIEALADRA
ncbi:MAG TPA: metal ABC transporter permease [Solirubrobacteraceae bacterium]|nr:metal ABC transporter permease [Solirubrobacteraceae bacterium]